MKKIILIFLVFFSIGCSLFLKLDFTDFKVDFVSENKELNEIIKEWSDNFILEAKAEFKNAKENKLDLAEKPKISSEFKEYEGKGIKSLVYKISKNIGKYEEKVIKIFYTDKNHKFLGKNIFILDTKHNENILYGKIYQKISILEGVYKDENILKDNLKSYINHPKFFLEGDKIIFLIEPGIVADSSKGIIEIKLDFDDLLNILNTEIFPEVKEKLQKIKEAEEKRLAEAKKSGKKVSFSEADALAKNSGKKYVALTFDDGPNNKTTPKLLDVLKKYDVKATFFVLGRMALNYPDVLKRTYNEGHEIANHSWDHPNLMNLKDNAVKTQIEKTDAEIEKIIGKKSKLVRPPYGAHNARIDNIIGKTIVMWDVDSMDWKNRNVQKNLNKTLPQVRNGSIILFHDIHQPSVDTIEPLIKKLKDQGYEFLTVSELLEIGQDGDFARKVCNNEFTCSSF